MEFGDDALKISIYVCPSRCFFKGHLEVGYEAYFWLTEDSRASLCPFAPITERTSETNFARLIAFNVSRGVNGAPAGIINHLRTHCVQLHKAPLSQYEPPLSTVCDG